MLHSISRAGPLLPHEGRNALLHALRNGEFGEREYNEWTSLPTFDGDEPTNTSGVWSWDADRLLVGEGRADLQIVPRGE